MRTGFRIIFHNILVKSDILVDFAEPKAGLATGDNNILNVFGLKWEFQILDFVSKFERYIY